MFLVGDVASVRPRQDNRFNDRDYVRLHVPTLSEYVNVETGRDLVKEGSRVCMLVRPGVSKTGKLYYAVKRLVDATELAAAVHV